VLTKLLRCIHTPYTAEWQSKNNCIFLDYFSICQYLLVSLLIIVNVSVIISLRRFVFIFVFPTVFNEPVEFLTGLPVEACRVLLFFFFLSFEYMRQTSPHAVGFDGEITMVTVA
jgi:hypothetical protein